MPAPYFCSTCGCDVRQHAADCFWTTGNLYRKSAGDRAKDLALLKEAVQYGQFSDGMLRQYGLAESIRQALFRLVGEA